MLKRVFIVLLSVVFACPIVSSAQSDTPADTLAVEPAPKRLSLLRRIIRGLDRTDKNYIEPQHYVFTVMLQATDTYDIYTLRSRGSDPQSFTFAPDMSFRIGPYLGWKWFFAGYTFKLGSSSFSDVKQELDFSIYSSQLGVDLFYRRTGVNYKIRDVSLGSYGGEGSLERIPFDGLSAGITGFNLYYVFNHGRFSYPAAFSQSTIQKVSCGSWLAGIGYTYNSISLDYEKLQDLINERVGDNSVPLDSGLMFRSVDYLDFNLSGGYAYNWVFAKNWLLSVCAQAALAYKDSKGDVIGDQRESFDFKNVNIDAIGRFGLVYNNMKWYAGLSAFVHSNNYRKSRFSTNNTFGSLNLYVGYNFGLKKKYRKKTE